MWLIAIQPSAHGHDITDAEIRAIVSYPVPSLPIAPRRPGARRGLYIGFTAPNQPWIEVIADLRNTAVADVFHAMMPRPELVASSGIGHLIDPDYAPQRA